MLGGGAKKRYCLENRFGKRRHAAAADLHEIGAVVGAFQSIGGRVSFGPVQTRGEGETHHERGTSRGLTVKPALSLSKFLCWVA